MSSETHEKEKYLRRFRKDVAAKHGEYVWLWKVRGMCVDLQNDPDIRDVLNLVKRQPQSYESLPPKGFPFKIERNAPGIGDVMYAWTGKRHREVNRKISHVLAALWYACMSHNDPRRFWLEMRDQILDLIEVYVSSAASAVKWGREVGVDKQSVPKEALFLHDYIAENCTDEKYGHMLAEIDTVEKKEGSAGFLFAGIVSAGEEEKEEEK